MTFFVHLVFKQVSKNLIHTSFLESTCSKRIGVYIHQYLVLPQQTFVVDLVIGIIAFGHLHYHKSMVFLIVFLFVVSFSIISDDRSDKKLL